MKIFTLVPLLVSVTLPSVGFSIADSGSTFYAITNLGCEACVDKLQPLLALYGSRVVQCDMREPENARRFDNISVLVGPEPYKTDPLVVVFRSGELVAVVFGFHSQGDWEMIMDSEYVGAPVYSNLHDASGRLLPDVVMADQDKLNAISSLFDEHPDDSHGHRDIYSLLPLVVTAALVDAINPCEFYVLVVFLSLVFFRIGKKAVLKAGLAYSAAVFLTYYLMGFGLWRLMDYAQQLRFFVVAVFGFLGLVVGLREVLGAFLGKEQKRVPDTLSRKLSDQLRRVSENPLTAFGIGIVSGVFLLPCTSAPYFTALILISDLGSFMEGLALLTVYNGIIIVPFVVITLCVHTLKLRTAKLKMWSAERQRWLNLVSGLLIIFLALYLLSTIIL